MIVRFDVMQDAAFQERDMPEEKKQLGAHHFWAPFSWIMLFVAGALFWYWIIGLRLDLFRS